MIRYRLLLLPTLIICTLALLAAYIFPNDAAAATEQATNGADITLPLNQTSYKIEVAEDGIYELSYDDLLAAGMTVLSVNPNRFQLMHRGAAVAYTFIGDADNRFEQGESIRFYGSAFESSDYERQYVTSNYYWLWAGGTRSSMSAVANSQGKPVATKWLANETTQPELIFNPGYFRWRETHEKIPTAGFGNM